MGFDIFGVAKQRERQMVVCIRVYAGAMRMDETMQTNGICFLPAQCHMHKTRTTDICTAHNVRLRSNDRTEKILLGKLNKIIFDGQ